MHETYVRRQYRLDWRLLSLDGECPLPGGAGGGAPLAGEHLTTGVTGSHVVGAQDVVRDRLWRSQSPYYSQILTNILNVVKHMY